MNKRHEIGYWFANLGNVVQTFSNQQFYDLNKANEVFFAKLFALLFGVEFIQLDKIKKNYPAIDIGDKINELSAQITSNVDEEKIEHTINMFLKYKLQYNKIYILEIKYIDPSQKKDSIDHNSSLSKLLLKNKDKWPTKADIFKNIKFYNLHTIVELILEVADQDDKNFEQIYELCKYNLGGSVAGITKESKEVAHLRQLCQSLSEVCKIDHSLQVPNISQSDIDIKKERFKDYREYFQSMIGLLKTLTDGGLSEKRYYEVMSTFDESTRQVIINYLQMISIDKLEDSNNDPREALTKICEDIKMKTNLNDYYESDIKGFLCYHFVYCNVFPNGDTSL